ncbi:MAG: hypothetical protein BWY32_03473 [bacterium ADurb.Bin243]|nr:MAG: hypothetical protein BWY32_03473 [bacterium ADurb.Bin243]
MLVLTASMVNLLPLTMPVENTGSPLFTPVPEASPSPPILSENCCPEVAVEVRLPLTMTSTPALVIEMLSEEGMASVKMLLLKVILVEVYDLLSGAPKVTFMELASKLLERPS